MRRLLNRRLLASLAASAALLLASGCGGDDPSFAGAVRSPALDVSGVTLPDAADGTPVAMRAADDEVYLVYFGYTSCPDVCPTTLSDISVALEDLSDAQAARVTVAMVTVDPERDTADVLTGYLSSFFDNSRALRTDDQASLAAAAEAFGAQWEVEDHEPGDDDYEVGHSAITYVVDDTGTVVVEWPFGIESADMTHDLRIVL